MATASRNASNGPIQNELDSIKRLLVLLLLKAGATQEEVGTALVIDQGTVSRMFSGVKIRRFTESN
jgi:DNA-directed RNA polymerase specialized sigma subunit